MHWSPLHSAAAQLGLLGLLGPVVWGPLSLAATTVRANGAQQVEDIDQLGHLPGPGHDDCGPRGGSWA